MTHPLSAARAGACHASPTGHALIALQRSSEQASHLAAYNTSVKMAFVSPSSVAEVLQKLYEIAKLIQEQVRLRCVPLTPHAAQVALYKNIGPRLHVLSLDLLATAGASARSTPTARC